ncbi:MAG: class I SAM-dependent methyltransferase [Bdellovibrionaceae bacterium]|nr:class I SAM-dependent methyltransferase [Pseudobdellovibrionaceae bacterium]
MSRALVYEDFPDFVLLNKPPGFSTHAVDDSKPGITELLSAQIGRRLYVVHRLDKETSGLLILAKSPSVAKDLAALFAEGKIHKTYRMRSSAKKQKQILVAKSYIFREGKEVLSDWSREANSVTEFTLSHDVCWYARPLTGKPHQIRLHARDSGLTILGDSRYGGEPYPTLCLQSAKLEFAWKGQSYSFSASEPFWWRETENFLAEWLAGIERRKLSFGPCPEQECLRLVHSESSNFRVDKLGHVIWIYWYRNSQPSEDEKTCLAEAASGLGCSAWIREMKNRGAGLGNSFLLPLGNPPRFWVASENGIKFYLRSDRGLSPGLFLDQRENRLRVFREAKGLRVLNLFCYTGGFSLAAALGGAREVCSVDVNRSYLQWAKENFLLNSLDPAQLEFWVQDSRLFLKGAVKRGRKFDLVICDPPSLGRSDSGVFRIEKDFCELLQDCTKVLSPKGKILFSTNYEKWSSSQWKKKIFSCLEKKFNVEGPSLAPLDFEGPTEEPLMKSWWISLH